MSRGHDSLPRVDRAAAALRLRFRTLLGSRYSWYIDVLLTLVRGLPSSDNTLQLLILRKLLEQPDYLLVLFHGTNGRESRGESARNALAERLRARTVICFSGCVAR